MKYTFFDLYRIFQGGNKNLSYGPLSCTVYSLLSETVLSGVNITLTSIKDEYTGITSGDGMVVFPKVRGSIDYTIVADKNSYIFYYYTYDNIDYDSVSPFIFNKKVNDLICYMVPDSIVRTINVTLTWPDKTKIVDGTVVNTNVPTDIDLNIVCPDNSIIADNSKVFPMSSYSNNSVWGVVDYNAKNYQGPQIISIRDLTDYALSGNNALYIDNTKFTVLATQSYDIATTQGGASTIFVPLSNSGNVYSYQYVINNMQLSTNIQMLNYNQIIQIPKQIDYTNRYNQLYYITDLNIDTNINAISLSSLTKQIDIPFSSVFDFSDITYDRAYLVSSDQMSSLYISGISLTQFQITDQLYKNAIITTSSVISSVYLGSQIYEDTYWYSNSIPSSTHKYRVYISGDVIPSAVQFQIVSGIYHGNIILSEYEWQRQKISDNITACIASYIEVQQPYIFKIYNINDEVVKNISYNYNIDKDATQYLTILRTTKNIDYEKLFHNFKTIKYLYNISGSIPISAIQQSTQLSLSYNDISSLVKKVSFNNHYTTSAEYILSGNDLFIENKLQFKEQKFSYTTLSDDAIKLLLIPFISSYYSWTEFFSPDTLALSSFIYYPEKSEYSSNLITILLSKLSAKKIFRHSILSAVYLNDGTNIINDCNGYYYENIYFRASFLNQNFDTVGVSALQFQYYVYNDTFTSADFDIYTCPFIYAYDISGNVNTNTNYEYILSFKQKKPVLDLIYIFFNKPELDTQLKFISYNKIYNITSNKLQYFKNNIACQVAVNYATIFDRTKFDHFLCGIQGIDDSQSKMLFIDDFDLEDTTYKNSLRANITFQDMIIDRDYTFTLKGFFKPLNKYINFEIISAACLTGYTGFISNVPTVQYMKYYEKTNRPNVYQYYCYQASCNIYDPNDTWYESSTTYNRKLFTNIVDNIKSLSTTTPTFTAKEYHGIINTSNYQSTYSTYMWFEFKNLFKTLLVSGTNFISNKFYYSTVDSTNPQLTYQDYIAQYRNSDQYVISYNYDTNIQDVLLTSNFFNGLYTDTYMLSTYYKNYLLTSFIVDLNTIALSGQTKYFSIPSTFVRNLQYEIYDGSTNKIINSLDNYIFMISMQPIINGETLSTTYSSYNSTYKNKKYGFTIYDQLQKQYGGYIYIDSERHGYTNDTEFIYSSSNSGIIPNVVNKLSRVLFQRYTYENTWDSTVYLDSLPVSAVSIIDNDIQTFINDTLDNFDYSNRIIDFEKYSQNAKLRIYLPNWYGFTQGKITINDQPILFSQRHDHSSTTDHAALDLYVQNINDNNELSTTQVITLNRQYEVEYDGQTKRYIDKLDEYIKTYNSEYNTSYNDNLLSFFTDTSYFESSDKNISLLSTFYAFKYVGQYYYDIQTLYLKSGPYTLSASIFSGLILSGDNFVIEGGINNIDLSLNYDFIGFDISATMQIVHGDNIFKVNNLGYIDLNYNNHIYYRTFSNGLYTLPGFNDNYQIDYLNRTEFIPIISAAVKYNTDLLIFKQLLNTQTYSFNNVNITEYNIDIYDISNNSDSYIIKDINTIPLVYNNSSITLNNTTSSHIIIDLPYYYTFLQFEVFNNKTSAEFIPIYTYGYQGTYKSVITKSYWDEWQTLLNGINIGITGTYTHFIYNDMFKYELDQLGIQISANYQNGIVYRYNSSTAESTDIKTLLIQHNIYPDIKDGYLYIIDDNQGYFIRYFDTDNDYNSKTINQYVNRSGYEYKKMYYSKQFNNTYTAERSFGFYSKVVSDKYKYSIDYIIRSANESATTHYIDTQTYDIYNNINIISSYINILDSVRHDIEGTVTFNTGYSNSNYPQLTYESFKKQDQYRYVGYVQRKAFVYENNIYKWLNTVSECQNLNIAVYSYKLGTSVNDIDIQDCNSFGQTIDLKLYNTELTGINCNIIEKTDNYIKVQFDKTGILQNTNYEYLSALTEINNLQFEIKIGNMSYNQTIYKTTINNNIVSISAYCASSYLENIQLGNTQCNAVIYERAYDNFDNLIIFDKVSSQYIYNNTISSLYYVVQYDISEEQFPLYSQNYELIENVNKNYVIDRKYYTRYVDSSYNQVLLPFSNDIYNISAYHDNIYLGVLTNETISGTFSGNKYIPITINLNQIGVIYKNMYTGLTGFTYKTNDSSYETIFNSNYITVSHDTCSANVTINTSYSNSSAMILNKRDNYTEYSNKVFILNEKYNIIFNTSYTTPVSSWFTGTMISSIYYFEPFEYTVTGNYYKLVEFPYDYIKFEYNRFNINKLAAATSPSAYIDITLINIKDNSISGHIIKYSDDYYQYTENKYLYHSKDSVFDYSKGSEYAYIPQGEYKISVFAKWNITTIGNIDTYAISYIDPIPLTTYNSLTLNYTDVNTAVAYNCYFYNKQIYNTTQELTPVSNVTYEVYDNNNLRIISGNSGTDSSVQIPIYSNINYTFNFYYNNLLISSYIDSFTQVSPSKNIYI